MGTKLLHDVRSWWDDARLGFVHERMDCTGFLHASFMPMRDTRTRKRLSKSVHHILKMGDPRLLRIAQPVAASAFGSPALRQRVVFGSERPNPRQP
ncbi:MAG: hypothetical protein ACO3YN_09960 [Rubrivivax sp.]